MARAIISFFIAMPLAVLINLWIWPGPEFWKVTLLVLEYVILYLIVYNLLSLFSPRAEEK